MAVLEKKVGIHLAACDAYVNIAGGMKMTEPAIDLGISLAVVSSCKDIIIPDSVIAFGEVGLSGEVRAVSMAGQRVAEAKKLGFSNTAIMDTKKLVFKPEYRKFCEENQCGCYNVNPACPPECGTVETMKQRVFAYEKALILQTIQSKDMDYKMAKLAHNKLTEQLASKIMESGNTDLLIMSAGPYRHYSCLSAYCVDAQEMADAVGMTCWGTDDKIRYFSQILFHGNL